MNGDEASLTLKAARAYAARGLGVFPLRGKAPAISKEDGGNGLYDATTDEAQLIEWFGSQYKNVGIAIPPGAYVLDVDVQHDGHLVLEKWVAEYGNGWLLEAPRQRTGNGGLHVWFRYDGPPLLYKHIAAPGIELGACGRYVVAAPSIHPDTRTSYRWEQPLPASLADLPPLVDFLVAFYEPTATIRAGKHRDYDGEDELDAAAHKMTSFPELLGRHGWQLKRGDGDSEGSIWRHPGATSPSSASIKHGCLFVYSPNTPFEETAAGDPHGITLYRAYATLEHGEQWSEASAALRDAGHLPPLQKATEVDEIKLATAPTLPALLDPQARLSLEDLTDIQVRRVRWLWEGRMPMSSLTLLAGREGEGKSTIAIDIMARTTRGELDGEYKGHPRDVIVIATEDSAEHTIVPRLLAAGADISRVYRVAMLEPGTSLSLPVHIPDLETACKTRDVGLIVLDPLLSRLGGNLDSHKDADVRRALEPLGAFADRIHAAVLGLIHLNKSGSTDPLTAVMASKAFTAFARSVMFAMVDPNDEARRLLGLVKSNLGRVDLPTLTYTFDPVVVGEDDGPIVATRVAWGPEAPTTIADALQAGNSEERNAIEEAADWLTDWLDGESGSGLAKVALAQGRAAGHSDRTLRRARERLGIEKKKVGFPPDVIWFWRDASITAK